jgi:hypothetical protein
MKTFLLFLLFTSLTFAQTSHFKIENKELVWEATFKTTDTDVLSQIDKYDKRVETNPKENTGRGVNLYSDCKLRRNSEDDYNEYKMNFNFKVDFSGDNYTVKVYAIEYDYDKEFRTDYKKVKFTKKFTEKKETILTTNDNKIRLLDCFEEKFISTFKTQNSKLQ